MTTTAVTIDRPTEADYPEWRRLYQGYAEFYRVPMDDAIARRLWGWLHDPGHVVEAFLAREGGGGGGRRPVGLAHFRAMPRPLAANTLCFLDDLFVDPGARGRGVGRALLEAVRAEARRRGWAKVRWITAEDNATARALYDRCAAKTRWVTYEMDAS